MNLSGVSSILSATTESAMKSRNYRNPSNENQGTPVNLFLESQRWDEWNQEDAMVSSFPGFHEIGGFPNDKDPLVVALLIGGKDKEALPIRRIPIG